MPRSTAMVAAWLVAAVVCVALSIYYFASDTAKSYLIGGGEGHHIKHGILFAALAVVALIGASMSRPRNVVG